MNFGKNGRVIYLVLSGVILLVFVVGLLCGGWLFSRWQQPAGLVTTVAFATVTPGGPSLTAEQPLSTPTGSTAAPCSPPAGWTLYTIQPSDTLSQLAEQAGVSQAQVLAVNCLASPEIVAGATLYLPSPPTPTPCTIVPPLGWGLYTAQPGDSLSALAAARNITIEEVERRNCLASPD
ncbi:MAG: LysM peptidoglycan-binding domain-containing protein, partial [Chloroflexi bacterium]|nr:LysM peptidoglycan-binding domain-containing protein [Chloroflexota bacterium]